MKPSPIAIIGMAGRFPGARNVTEFWRNLRDGIESIRDRSNAELIAAGVSPQELTNPDYVKRAAMLEDVSLFDASFFGFSPRDASIMDPQHRHLFGVCMGGLGRRRALAPRLRRLDWRLRRFRDEHLPYP